MVGRRAMGLTGGTCSPVRTRPSHNCRDTRGAINAPPTSETNGPTDASLPARDNPAVVSAWASTSLRRPSVATTHRSLENAVVGKARAKGKRHAMPHDGTRICNGLWASNLIPEKGDGSGFSTTMTNRARGRHFFVERAHHARVEATTCNQSAADSFILQYIIA